MNIQRLSSRIVLFFTCLVLLLAFAGFTVISAFISRYAERQLADELVVGERVFRRMLEDKRRQLEQAAAVLAGDFAFRAAVATNDRDTLVSALQNHGHRINASLMMMVDLNGRVTANTLPAAAPGEQFPYSDLLTRARGTGQASGIVVAGDRLYQMVLVAVRAPVTIGWVAMGFVVDDAIAGDLGALTRAEVTFAVRAPGAGWQVIGTTLAAPAEQALATRLNDMLANMSPEAAEPRIGETDLTLVSMLNGDRSQPAVALLQRSLDEALASFERLRSFLGVLALMGLAAAVLGSFGIARSITGPLSKLADVARSIANGDYTRPVEVTASDEVGALAAAFNQMREGIAARESTIMDLAYRDPLTGLPNRALFNDRLQQAIATAKRARGAASVLMIDLDNFRYVNSTLGHQMGDLLLKEVALRVEGVLLGKSDTLARLGGDEFAILLPTDGSEDACNAATRVLQAVESALDVGGHTVDVSLSIGIVTCPEHGEDVATLMSRVDLSMTVAKRSKSGFAEYSSSYDQTPERLSLLSELRSAVENDELVLFYQPKIALASGLTTHVEALVRWQHPVRGFIPPDQFIPFAEQTGYIRVITQWVLEAALKQLVAWRTAGVSMNMCVNISARDLLNVELPNFIAGLLRNQAADPGWLWLEITESAIMDDPVRAQDVIDRLHRMGLHLSIDDFGTGYSSLAYLKRLPVDELKIDKTFVLGMNKDPDDAIIVRSTIELAHNMGLKVVAEGVDNEESLAMLTAWGCDIGQGYFMSRPLPIRELEAWLAVAGHATAPPIAQRAAG